jgi:thiol-disulfide isomerase/thioredoxin
MRLPDVLGVLGALAVGLLLAVVLLATATGGQPTLPSPVPPTLPPLPSFALASPAPAGPSPTPAASSVAEGVAIGQRAPTIELTLIDGSVMSTADFVGKPMWINFMATWCPQCRDELPMMERYAGQLGDTMTVVVVDVGEDRQTVRQFIRELGVDLTVGVDPDSSVQSEWGVYALPVHFWLDADGIVQEIVYGGAPREIFIQAITEVVPEFSAEDEPTDEPPLTLPPESIAPESSTEASPAS